MDDKYGMSTEEASDRKDAVGIWSIHLSGILGEEGRFSGRRDSSPLHLEYSLARCLWRRILMYYSGFSAYPFLKN